MQPRMAGIVNTCKTFQARSLVTRFGSGLWVLDGELEKVCTTVCVWFEAFDVQFVASTAIVRAWEEGPAFESKAETLTYTTLCSKP